MNQHDGNPVMIARGALICMCCILLAACLPAGQLPPKSATVSVPMDPTSLPLPPAGRTAAEVVRVVDGDTILVTIAGEEFRVRYIGINSPELGHDGAADDPFAQEAAAANRALVEGQTVYLEKDVSETDRHGRLLRYVFLEDGTFVNATLVRSGLAWAREYPPDLARQDELMVALDEAGAASRGLWALDPTPAAGMGGETCDPAYPDVCIPPAPPDLDCGDIGFREFRVLPPDPHNFDGDGDGVGCWGG